MSSSGLSAEAERAVNAIQRADIVIGIPSFNNARTIGHVVRACYAGLHRYFPQMSGVVINSDGGSTDGTREAVLSASVDEHALMLLSTPMYPVHRLSFPYHGIPGKGSAFRMVFEMARRLGARACAVVDSDLRSITPEWIDLLLRPILLANYEFVAPYYHRHIRNQRSDIGAVMHPRGADGDAGERWPPASLGDDFSGDAAGGQQTQ
jgi:glycosyltransferase involved in cell wall biosynthesis